MCETVRSTSSMRSRFQPLRMLRKCSSCSLFMYASPRLVMYGVTLRGPASRLPASGLSSESLSLAAARAALARPGDEGTPLAVTTMRSEGGDLRMACATGVAFAGAAWAAAGFAAGLAGGARGLAAAAGVFGAAGFAAVLAATGFVAGFFAVNLGFSTFFGLAGFAAARLVGMSVSLQARSGRGAGLQDAGLYRRVLGCTAA